MVTREYPVDGADRSQIERAHRDGRVKRLRDVRPDLPSEFIQTVERALSPDPAARPQTAGELEAALTRQGPTPACRDGRGGSAPRRSPRQSCSSPCRWGGSCGNRANDRGTATVHPPAAAVEPHAATPAAAVNPSYTVKADAVPHPQRRRNAAHGRHQPRRLATRCRCSIEASKEVYVYVLNADDAGKSYRLFPLPDHQPDNPLAPAKEHRLPGDGRELGRHERRRARALRRSWSTPVRKDAVEALVQDDPRRDGGRGPVTRAAIPPDDIGVLRSVGGLVERPRPSRRRANRRCCGSRRPATSRDNGRPRAAPGCAA